MNQLERIAYLYLSFINNPSGLSYEQIRFESPQAYQGEPESMRRKFERDKVILKMLGLELQYQDSHSFLSNSKKDVYKLANFSQEAKIPTLRLSNEQASHIGLLLLKSISQKGNIVNPQEKEEIKNIMRKLFYFNHQFSSEEKIQLNSETKNKSKKKLELLVSKLEKIKKNETQQNQSQKRYLELIHKSLKNKNSIEISYTSTKKNSPSLPKSKITLWPHGLISYKGRWCMIAYNPKVNVFKYYYLEHISELNITDKEFKSLPNFDILKFSLHPLSIGMHPVRQVLLQIHPEYEEVFQSYLEPVRNHLQNFKQENFKFSFLLGNTSALFRWIFSHPTAVEKLGPSAIHKSFKDFIQEIRENYNF